MLSHSPLEGLGGLHGLWRLPLMIYVLATVEYWRRQHWGLNHTYPPCLRPNVCPSYCLFHPNNNEVTTYPHNFIELSLHWISYFFLCVGANRRVLKTTQETDFSSVVRLSSGFLREAVSLHYKVRLHLFSLGLENDHFCCDYQMFWGAGLNSLRTGSS